MSLDKEEDHNAEKAPQAGRDRREASTGRCFGLTRQSVADAVRAIGVTEVTYYRWRQEFGGLKSDKVKKLKDLETEKARLRRTVSDLTLDKMILAEAARGNVWSAPPLQGLCS